VLELNHTSFVTKKRKRQHFQQKEKTKEKRREIYIKIKTDVHITTNLNHSAHIHKKFSKEKIHTPEPIRTQHSIVLSLNVLKYLYHQTNIQRKRDS
jgi:hypothetical protein